MSSAAIVCIVLGSLIVISRALIVVAPAATLGWFKAMIGTESRVRTVGICSLFLPGLMIWVGVSEDTPIAYLLLIFGLFFLLVAIPWLVFFPRSYMELVDWLLPSDLMAWRMLGLLGVIVGLVLVYFGWGAL